MLTRAHLPDEVRTDELPRTRNALLAFGSARRRRRVHLGRRIEQTAQQVQPPDLKRNEPLEVQRAHLFDERGWELLDLHGKQMDGRARTEVV